MSDMKRRELIALLGGAAATWPFAARAQQPAMPVIGFLNPYPETDPDLNNLLLAFKLRLREHGWTDGQNLRIDVRFVGHDYGAARAAVDWASERVFAEQQTAPNYGYPQYRPRPRWSLGPIPDMGAYTGGHRLFGYGPSIVREALPMRPVGSG